MELKTSSILLVFSVLLISSCIPVSYSAKKPVLTARKEDIPFIKCQVCEKLAAQLHQQVDKKQTQISPKKVTEFDIIEIAENVCNLKKEEGDWILKIDIVENGKKLELVEQDTEGECNSECKTVERACQEPKIDVLVNYLCKDLTKACSVKPPADSQGEPFIPKSDKQAEMERIMRSMQGMPGAPGMKMYSKDDLLKKNFGAEEEKRKCKRRLDEEDYKENFKHWCSLKIRANKATRRIQQWWRKRKQQVQKKRN
ncbi:hypothetical protein MKW92_014020 [Papaver armeniacum]|nr:hypothetical protein MKW92_014020 [Papaver armeniacum]